MGVFSEEENSWNGGQFESDFQAWEYFIVGSGLPGVKCQLSVSVSHNSHKQPPLLFTFLMSKT